MAVESSKAGGFDDCWHPLFLFYSTDTDTTQTQMEYAFFMALPHLQYFLFSNRQVHTPTIPTHSLTPFHTATVSTSCLSLPHYSIHHSTPIHSTPIHSPLPTLPLPLPPPSHTPPVNSVLLPVNSILLPVNPPLPFLHRTSRTATNLSALECRSSNLSFFQSCLRALSRE